MEADRAELDCVVAFTDGLIAQGKYDEAAFWIGFQWGIRHRHFGHDSFDRPESLRFFLEIAERAHSRKFLGACACGYLNGIEGRSTGEILVDGGETMAEITRFQRINGCSVCKQAKHKKEDERRAAEPGKFWCKHLNKTVDWKEGAACLEWTCER